MGDGELQEGQNWEAIMYAAHMNLNNIIVTIDYNRQQIDGNIEDIMSFYDLNSKFSAFGWNVFEMDGNNMDNILETIKTVKANQNDKPSVVVMKTEMGAGVDFMMGSHEWHGIPPNDEQLARALNQLKETQGDY